MNALNVAKFGGTSVADYTAMSNCAAVIKGNLSTRLVVISACSGVTNLLVELANGVANDRQQEVLTKLHDIHFSILKQLPEAPAVASGVNAILDEVATLSAAAETSPSDKITDALVACGELMSTHIFTHLLNDKGINAVRADVRDVLKTDNVFGKATPDLIETAHHAETVLTPLFEDKVVVTQGFIGSDAQGNTTTLGRGGSDYSAALLAEAIKATSLEIWTDVPGIYSTDPRVAPAASPIDEISFSEASEMANFGAKILHPATLIPAMRQDIPVFVGSSKAPEQGGTWIRHQAEKSPLFRALALRCNQTMVTLTSLNMFHAYGFLAEVFNILAKHKVSVDLITTSEVSVSLTLDQTNTKGGAPKLPEAAEQELAALCKVTVEQDMCLVALIGNHMSESKGAAAKIFSALEDYNLRMICYGASNHNLCFLTSTSESKEVVRALHKELFED
ncbi:lysine-sensitive aspartokinase 3 [Grimontia sp. NTOU-MAR1]|uniref:lysine-sensitive aspartokinase 3 n=1 Tax=Grimontia sp. NTOU-MAR1 TaxID=3111011 RepID=UPI002DC054CD|nr:lysine-sensitive aspartokinase 3 [Grimontia sp. NTOU-MAR1]WRV96969.1 lysine-sensitive aspartokinase 3 [Grimontia sp. NTOU-MAR1]